MKLPRPMGPTEPVPISNVAPFTEILRVPDNAEGPAMCFIENLDATAVIRVKWISTKEQTANFSTTGGQKRLLPGDSFTWDTIPAGFSLVGLSSVSNALLAVDAMWVQPEEALLA